MDRGVIEAPSSLISGEFDVAWMSKGDAETLPCRLRNVVLELLCSLDFKLAVLVEGIIGWELKSHVVEVVLCEVSETVGYGFETSRFRRSIWNLRVGPSNDLG